MEKNIINLNKVIKDLTEKYVKHYKSDCDHDLNIMISEKDYGDEFFVYLRESGTELMVSKHLFFKESAANTIAKYYRNAAKKLLKVNIIKRGRKNLYGTIETLSVDNFIESIKNNEKDIVNEELLIRKYGGEEIKIVVPRSNNSFYTALNKLELNELEVQKALIINYQ